MSEYRDTIKKRDGADNHDIVIIKDPNLAAGFAQVPRLLLKTKLLSDKAKLVYALLLDYAWQQGNCFPGQQTLADDLDTTVRTIQRALCELRDTKLVTWNQRGVKQTNVYYVLPLSESHLCMLPNDLHHLLVSALLLLISPSSPHAAQSDTTKMSPHSDTTKMSCPDATQVSYKVYSEEVEEDKYSSIYSNRENSRTERTGMTSVAALVRTLQQQRATESTLRDIGSEAVAVPNQQKTSPTSLPIENDGTRARDALQGRRTALSKRDLKQLLTYVTDLSKEFDHGRHTQENMGHMLNIFNAAYPITLGSFIDIGFAAGGLTREYKAEGKIRRNAMQLYFAILEDKLQLPSSRKKGHQSYEHGQRAITGRTA